MSRNRIDMVINKDRYVKYYILTNNLLLVIWQKYVQNNLEQHKLLVQNGFLSVDIDLKSHF